MSTPTENNETTGKREREEYNGAVAQADGESDEASAKRIKQDTDDAAASSTGAPAAAGDAAAAQVEVGDKDKKVDTKEDAKPVADAKAEDKKPLSLEEAESEMLKLLEFYFGDSNFGWDRFMQAKAGKTGDGFMDITTLTIFNKVKAVISRTSLNSEDATAMIARVADSSSKLKVSEDRKQIGRAVPLTPEANEERHSRTVQAKGWDKDCDITIEAAEELFERAGKIAYVKICRAGGKNGEKKKLTSMFIEFKTKEGAEKALTEQLSYEGALITVRKTDVREKGESTKKEENDEIAEPTPTPVPEFEPGKIVHITGIPDAGVSREALREGTKQYGTIKFVDFSFGKVEAYVRFEEAPEAAAAVEGLKDGLPLGDKDNDIKEKGVVTLLQGKDETAYYVKVEESKMERMGNRNSSGRGKFKSKRGGRGRGRGRR